MHFQQFLRDDLGCASYLIGSNETGAAAVVDPQWDISGYLESAQAHGLHITHIIETHTHADHVSGHGKLAAQTGAAIAVYETAGAEYPHQSLADGDVLRLGEVEIRVLHTPGHRPEHISLAVTDRTQGAEPRLVLSGDALFVGAVGRPDLAVEPDQGARDLYHSLHEKLLALPDAAELYPAHVAGSLCGKDMSAAPSSTIGAERRFNRALQLAPESVFVADVTEHLPPQPPQFQRIVARNRGPLVAADPPVPLLGPVQVASLLNTGVQVIDTRHPTDFGLGHLPGALNVCLKCGHFPTWAAWVVNPDQPIVLVLDQADPQAALSGLLAVGLDRVAGELDGGMAAWTAAGLPTVVLKQLPVGPLHDALDGTDGPLLLDVREDDEWAGGHVAGAVHIPYEHLVERIAEVPRGRTVATMCAGGVRSSLAASLLQRAGYTQVLNVPGGFDAWKQAGLPTSTEG